MADQQKPNILIIWGDDIGWYNISAYNLGVMGYRTPNIDRLAKEGALPSGLAAQGIPLLDRRRQRQPTTRVSVTTAGASTTSSCSSPRRRSSPIGCRASN